MTSNRSLSNVCLKIKYRIGNWVKNIYIFLIVAQIKQHTIIQK